MAIVFFWTSLYHVPDVHLNLWVRAWRSTLFLEQLLNPAFKFNHIAQWNLFDFVNSYILKFPADDL